MFDLQEIGQYLKSERIKKMSFKRLCLESNLAPRTANSIEFGRYEYTVISLVKYLRVLDISLLELIKKHKNK